MSETETPPVPETPIPATIPIGALESVAEYRKASAEGLTEVPNPAVPPPAEKAETAPAEKEPDPASEAGKELAKKRTSLQARIDQAVAQQRAAEARAAAAEAKLAEREAAKGEPKADAATAAGYYTRPEPSVDEIGTKYATYEEYTKDLAKWAYQEERAKERIEDQQTQAQQTQRDVLTKAQARIDAFKTDHADYDEVVAGAIMPQGAVAGPAIIEYLNHSEMGPQLAYALGKDPTELARIALLPPGFAIAALGKLEGKLEAPATEPAAAVSHAPAPPKPVGGRGSGKAAQDPSEINSLADWRKRRADFV